MIIPEKNIENFTIHEKLLEILLKEPLSTENPAFIKALEGELLIMEKIYLLVRYPRSGGAHQDLFIAKISDLKDIIKKSPKKTSISAFFFSNYPIKGELDGDMKKLILKKIQARNKKELHVIKLDSNEIIPFESQDQFIQWSERNYGIQLIFGDLEWWHNNNARIITAYKPGVDCHVRPGIY